MIVFMSRLILFIYTYPYPYFAYSRGIMRGMTVVIKVMVSALYIAISLGVLITEPAAKVHYICM
jgi:hypothetical protein